MAITYLLIGGAGFIGSRVAYYLHVNDPECNIHIIDSFDCYDIMNGKEYAHLLDERLNHVPCYVHTVDITNRSKTINLINEIQPDVVIHLAAYPRVALVDRYPENGITVLTLGLKNVLDACTNVEHFVYISSSMVYGDFPDHPPHEQDVCNPTSAYAVYKYGGEMLVKDWATHLDQRSYSIVRPSAVYGPCDVTERVISLFFKAALQDETLHVKGPQEMLDFTFIDDIANGIMLATTNRKSDTFNMTYSKGYTLLEAASTIIEIVGKGKLNCEQRDDSFPVRGALNISNAKQQLGYDPQFDLKTGLQFYYVWLTNNL